MARNVVMLLGGPGAGKGTQAKTISVLLGIPHISTGQLLRAEAAASSTLGLRVRAVMESGDLVSDEIVNDLIRERIQQSDCTPGFLLDGYPRDTNQAVVFRSMIGPEDHLIVIDIETDLDKVLPRLTGRRTCRSCNAIYHLSLSPPKHPDRCDLCGGLLEQRADDREDVIRERFRTYHRLTEPLARLYQEWGVYFRVDGMRPPDQVGQDIRAHLVKEIPELAVQVGSGS